MALWGRLDLTPASVALRRDAGDRVGFLSLEHLIGRLLVLSGHGMGLGLRKVPDDGKENQADGETFRNEPGNFSTGAGGFHGARPMGTESNPVSCLKAMVSGFDSFCQVLELLLGGIWRQPRRYSRIEIIVETGGAASGRQ